MLQRNTCLESRAGPLVLSVNLYTEEDTGLSAAWPPDCSKEEVKRQKAWVL